MTDREPKRYCRTCSGHIYRRDRNDGAFYWTCAKDCTRSVVMLKGAPFPTEFEYGGPA